MTNNWIPVNRPRLAGRELEYVTEAITGGWISSEGPFVRRFEEEFAASCGREYGVAVANGTAALDIAIAALQLSPGDEVILPAHTIISCASAITRSGAVPVVVDSSLETWNMDVSAVEALVTERTRAVMAVHIFGLPVDMDPLVELCNRRGLMLIEDASQAIGYQYKGRVCGGFGDLSTFSFFVNKNITTGEGGMVTTNNPALVERLRSFRNLCFRPGRRFVHDEIGWNYRITNVQAAIGVAQLEKLDEHLKIKRAIGLRYRELLDGINGIQLPPNDQEYAINQFWVFGLMIGDHTGVDAQAFSAALKERNVDSRPFFWPIHKQPVYLKQGLFDGVSMPVAEKMAGQGFYIPCGIGLLESEATLVANAVRDIASLWFR